jgi:hypothetical protein
VLRVITDPEPDSGPPWQPDEGQGALDDLVSSVRSLAWIVGPAAPRTVARIDQPGLRFHLPASRSVDLSLVVENQQAAAAPITAVLSPFNRLDGAVWTPHADMQTVVLGPREVRRVVLRLHSDSPPAPGVYEGSLQLLGAEGAVFRIVAEVAA